MEDKKKSPNTEFDKLEKGDVEIINDEPVKGKVPQVETGSKDQNDSDKKDDESKSISKSDNKGNTAKRHGVKKKKADKFDKEKLKAKFHGYRASKENPIPLILEQHQQHRMRVAKIVAIIVILFFIAIVSYQGMLSWQNEQNRLSKIDDINKKLVGYDAIIANSDSYEKSKAALSAVLWINKAFRIDFERRNFWEAKKEKYLEVVGQSKVKEGNNFINPSCLADMVYIPPGKFDMGRRANERGGNDELPRHPVILPKGFWMSRTEVTIAQYRQRYPGFKVRFFDFKGNDLGSWGEYKFDKSYQPVVKVEWNMAKEFCDILTNMEEKAGRVPDGYEYRLPTEAEWEYCCRAGTETYYYWSDDFREGGETFANTWDYVSSLKIDKEKNPFLAKNDKFRVSAPVGSYKPNAFGLYDMSGNVAEWCLDWYNPEAYKTLPELAPFQAIPVTVKFKKNQNYDRYYQSGTRKVVRGGSWAYPYREARSAARMHESATVCDSAIGFRIVLAPKVKL